MADFNTGDYLSQILGFVQTTSDSTKQNTASLDKIQQSVQSIESILKNGGTIGSAAYGRMNSGTSSPFSDAYKQRVSSTSTAYGKRKPGNFSDGLEQALEDALFGSDYKNKINDALNKFASDLGTSIEDLPGQLGRNLGDIAIDAFKGTGPGKKLLAGIEGLQGKAESFIRNSYAEGKAKYFASHAATSGAGAAGQAAATGSKVASGTSAAAGGAKAGITAGTATSANAAMAGFVNTVGKSIPQLAAVTVGLTLLDTVTGALGKSLANIGEKFDAMLGALGAAYSRDRVEREKQAENAQKRLEADVKTLIETPFKILEEAANKVYDVWDANLRLINGTQGYTKADLQTLMGNFAERLRSEGLTSVVDTASVTESLAKVLQSGLSGAVAEEFAYQATKLNAAVPNQDFYGYASTYASLAANMIAQGASEAEALQYANSQLELFASNVLYASRQLTGGFSTGLQDAQSLFEDAVQIAQASRTGDPSQIAGVLTSVAAITGAIAPDLASSMTDAIVQAATGGNSSQIVALRSLAGINASNTEFLKQLAENPQQVFSTLFTNLAQMQNMADGAYMEVAEGLSDVFGVSMDAFARIDFNYLANAISSMSVSTASLDENIAHLASGETTTSAEQLRMQQINEYMLEEGLAYVLDNEAARAIQQHMWDEQLANKVMENQFAVDLVGSSQQLLTSIVNFLDLIMNVLTLGLMDLGNVLETTKEARKLDDNVAAVLEAGKVGTGNARDKYNLTTRGQDLNLTSDLASLLLSTKLGSVSYIADALTGGYNGIQSTDATSAYTWGNIGKSAYRRLQGSGQARGAVVNMPSGTSSGLTAEEAVLKQLQSSFERMTDPDYINQFVDEGKSYDDWVKTANNFGISDIDAALYDLGYDESQLQAYFRQAQTQASVRQQVERTEREELFWDNTEQYQLETKDNTYAIIDLLTTTNATLDSILSNIDTFYTDWVDYYINQVYFRDNFTSKDESRIKSAEKEESSKAIYTLAEILTSGNKDLLDPTIQTNAILAQILIVVQSIMQQNNTAGGLSIPDSLSAMATGLFNYSSK